MAIEECSEVTATSGMTGTYSPEDNKLRLYSLHRLATEDYQRVRAAGFIWAPKQDLFVAPMWTPARADLLLELCGEIGDEDTALVDRAEERAERFEVYSDKREADAHAAHAAVERIADGIPLGQPILVGHHSEKHARKDAERIQNGMRRAVKMWETSKYWEARAKGAIRHAKYKELPGVRLRRIKGLEADKRRHERSLEQSLTFAKLWRTPDLTREAAQKIANIDRGCPFGTWSSLDKSEITAEQARETALAGHARIIEDAQRWIAHLDLRLGYERVMLGDVSEPVKVRRALPPMANYKGEGTYTEMTKAEYAKIHKDYKGTRIVRGARVRTAIVRGSLVPIFLTDSKVVEPPREGSDEVPRFKDRPEPEFRTHVPREAPAPTPFDAMKASLKAGVQVVSAPQLFPTPPELAARMVETVAVEVTYRVLEPSAGTGNILRAVRTDGSSCELVAVEVSESLVSALRPYCTARAIDLRCADFLDIQPDELAPFDRILMNPPFKDAADVQHILHARKFLKPGGLLVAICANGSRQREKLEPIADTWEELPEGSFASEGTGVRTVMLTMRG